MLRLSQAVKIHEKILNEWNPEVADFLKPVILIVMTLIGSQDAEILKHMDLNSFYRAMSLPMNAESFSCLDNYLYLLLPKSLGSNESDRELLEKMMFLSAKKSMGVCFHCLFRRGVRLSQESEDILNSKKYSKKTRRIMELYYGDLGIDPPFKVYSWSKTEEQNQYPEDPHQEDPYPEDGLNQYYGILFNAMYGAQLPNYGGAQLPNYGGAQELDKIKNPETNRMIIIGGATYKKLIKNGYEHIGDQLIKR